MMYPSFGNEDASLYTFPENIYTNPSSSINHENISSLSSMFNYFPCSPLSNYGEEAMFFQQFQDILHKKFDDQEMVNHDIDMIQFSDDKCCIKNMSNVNKVILSSCGGSKNDNHEIREKPRCKKDKHSKIMTANGSSRGRRMRLSIDVAKEFFGLQDMLGFDKASKTVEWLLEKSKNAIKELSKEMKHSSSPSSASVLSAVDEIEPEVATKDKTKEGKGVRKLAVSHPLARELREKARARARERTSEKKKLHLIGGCTQQMNLGSFNPFVEELPQKLGDSFCITNSWNNSSTIFLNHQNNSEAKSNKHQFTGFQYDGKPREGFM